MAEVVVSCVVERLGDFIIQKAKFLHGVSEQVAVAQIELQLMRGFLKDADARQAESEVVRICLAQIRDAAYDLEDVIESYALNVASNGKGGFMNAMKRFGCILKGGVDLNKIGTEIGNITTKISHSRSSLQAYNIRECGAASTAFEAQQPRRISYAHVSERDVVGFDDSVKELVAHLVNEKICCHRVVSIWGMGGCGKTTLAKQVYHHKEVRLHFESFAWVCVSQTCQARDVWEGILIKLLSATEEQRGQIAKMKDDEIAEKLYLVQKESKCLVVVDDIWGTQTWDSLRGGFPLYEETKSRILLTTRKEEVAAHVADRNGFLHQPRPLNEDESWQLFERIAFFGRRHETMSEIYAKMKELGKKMLRHCAGLPLAITVLAGVLVRKETIDDWDVVHKNVYAYLRRGKDHKQEHEGVSWVLGLSYDDLPYYLKACFVYLGHFPEDFEIPVKRLIQLWMAEGLTSSVQQRQGVGETPEDVAYNCLVELVERCVVQVGERGSIRKIKTCRIHDLMRDLCLLKAEQENFLHLANFSQRSNQEMSSLVPQEATIGKVRRLIINLEGNADTLVPSRNERDSHLRSLLYFSQKEWMVKHTKFMGSLFENYRLLRVLIVEDMATALELPSTIGNLLHLRFLSIRDSEIKRLPSSLGKLMCLQTLDLRCYHSVIVPNVIWKMEQLRHLYLPFHYRARGKLRLDTLHNLQTLVHVSSRYCDMNHVFELPNLRKLAIQVSSPLENLDEILKSTRNTLNGIRSLFVHNLVGTDSCADVIQLVVTCRHLYKLDLNGPTVEIPESLQNYPNLTKLSLFGTHLKDNQMEMLEKLPRLRILHLGTGTFEENTSTLVCSKGGFPCLLVLFLGWMDEIKEWRVEEGAMPNLSELYIAHCGGLKTIPDGLQYTTTLKKLNITAMPKTFYIRLQEGGDDFHKIKHVPSLEFGATLEELVDN